MHEFELMALGADVSLYPWLPFEHTPVTELAFVVAHRIHMLARIETNPDISATIRLSAAQWADAHMPLVVNLENVGCYNNDTVLTMLQRYEPRCEFIVHPGAMPNLTSYLISFVNTGPETDKNDVASMIGRLARKPMPQRCIGRGFGTLVIRAAEAHESIRELMLHVVTVGLMGSYETAQIRPKFPARKHLYTLLVLSPVDIMDVLSKLRNAMFHLIREYIIFNVNCLTPLKTAIEQTYPWDTFSDSARVTVDAMRARVARNHDRLTRTGMPCEPATFMLNGLNSIKPTTVPKRQKPTNFWTARTLRGIFDDTEMMLLSTLGTNGDMYAVYKLAARDLVATLGLEESVRALERPPFGLSQTAVRALANGIATYHSDGNRDKLHAIVMQLGQTDIVSYETIRVLVDECAIKESVRVIKLPDDVTNDQRRALQNVVAKAYSGHAADVPLPSKFAVCTICPRFCGFVSELKDKRAGSKASTTRSHPMGNMRLLASPNLITADIVYTCGVHPEHVSETRRRSVNVDPVTSHGLVPADATKELRKRARELRMSKLHRRCRDESVLFVDMLGHCVQIIDATGNGTIYMLCCVCAQPFVYDPKCMRQAESTCHQCIAALKVVKTVHHCVMCSIVMPVILYTKVWTRTVVVDNLAPADRPRWFSDWDVPGPVERTVWFCPKHTNTWVVNHSPPLPLDVALFSCRKDPHSGMFAVGSFAVGGEYVGFERKWSRTTCTDVDRPAMFMDMCTE